MKKRTFGLLSCFGFLLVLFLFVEAQSRDFKYTVFIDPAHGGSEKGVKLSDKEWEKDVTLKIALLMKQILEKDEGFSVFLTRTSDRDVSPQERQKVLKDVKEGILLSLHINGAFGKSASGYECYFPGFKNKNQDIVGDMIENKRLNDSVALANIILKNLQEIFPRKGRGLREAPFLLYEGLKIPALVIEIGFGTNQEDRKILLEEAGQKKIALILARSVKDYFKQKR